MTLTLPTPVLPDPDAVPALRWGVIGTGIAGKFVTAIHRHTPQRAVAVTARDAAKTSAFAAAHGIDRTVSSVEALVTDAEVDVVYVATPHPLHREQALAAIAAGKHVLIEKPIAMSAAEAQEVTGAGRAAGVLVMEAMWTRYLPQSDIMRRLLTDGTIGTVRLVTADFGFVMPYDPGHRLWAPELGGGALLDAGVYPISFAASVLGSPDRVLVEGASGPGGVDVRADLLLSYAGGARSMLSTSLETALPVRASVVGTEGRIDIGSPFFGPSSITAVRGNFAASESATWTDQRLEVLHDGLAYQATALASFAAEGRIESPVHTHDDVVGVMRVIDTARATITAAS
ncbi:Gfo/Idh/MocA family oxidoreductase [Curtobacterium sp. MCJR17_020]|uniref:Gfo/Idh/MocA family protein n=1 Tax=Curtobacterium sp. MCJR17_020 TaxID=2175619 RepID=UPI000DA77DAF|nr:Gfo/Idh/MocA family oxidoreductase [Curtobacterium sp. MCJR17_020]WIE72965.1 Gfo/Idh/MocA family oxidoreductase [Curtobacterium sp. MCJR17_020]